MESIRCHPKRALFLSAFLAMVIGVVQFTLFIRPASALLTGKVAILSTTVSGRMSSPEAQQAAALGLTVEIKTPAQWAAMTAADFAGYRALILGDPNCPSGTSAISAAVANKAVWGPTVTGNVVVVGTDPTWHYNFGGRAAQTARLMSRGIAFAADIAGKPGMYVTLSCYYHGAGFNTPVPLLDAFAPAGFAVTGVGCFNDAHIVASHPALTGLTDADLSNWSCSVHEAFTRWPSNFSVLAMARGIGSYTAADGSVGTPYILARGEGLSASDINLAPATATAPVGTSHTVTATVTSGGSPVTGQLVNFGVIAGPHTGTSGTGTTAANGMVSFSYTGTSAGIDDIRASFTNGSITQSSNIARMEWLAAANEAPSADAGGPYADDEGAVISLTGTASDPDGDSLSYIWTQVASSGTDAGAACTFSDNTALSPTMVCNDDGTFDLTLEVNDGINPPVVSNVSAVIANVAPGASLVGPSAGSLYALGTPVDLAIGLNDQGTNDEHTCSVDWDDLSASAGVVTESLGSGSCDASHTFGGAGVYTIAATIDDLDGGTAQVTTMVIVYDPSAGFVTGGGHFDSPAGSYRPDPTLTGRANFGFVSKYKKGTNIPTGQTEFQFKAGELNFHSDAYEWLVVSGHKAQYKGTGTINGLSGYGFMLTVTDGQQPGGGGVDKFRMKIWDISGGVIYDNSYGSSDDMDGANPLAISAGSIVIHK